MLLVNLLLNKKKRPSNLDGPLKKEDLRLQLEAVLVSVNNSLSNYSS